MNKKQRGRDKDQTDISEFLSVSPRKTRQASKLAAEVGKITTVDVAQNKMVTNEDLQSLIKEMRADINSKMEAGFTDIHKKVDKLTEKVDGLEKDIAAVRSAQEEDRSEIENVKKDMADISESLNEISATDMGSVQKCLEQILARVKALEVAELENAVHSRKYNLMVHGIPGKETDNAETERKIRDFAKDSLKLDTTFAESVLISNCHRLPKKSNTWGKLVDSDPIVVKFVKWADRMAFLKATTNLACGPSFRVRTHLPAVLAKARAKISTTAYELRQEGTYARVRERGASVVMEIQEKPMGKWKAEKLITTEQLVTERNEKLYQTSPSDKIAL